MEKNQRPRMISDKEKLIHSIKTALTCGWASASISLTAQDERKFAQLMREIGTPLPSRPGAPAIDVLSPKTKQAARPRSLSAQFGGGEFPPHIDGAHWDEPPRIIILYCVFDRQSRPTFLWRWTKIRSALSVTRFDSSAIYLFKNRQQSFYDTIESTSRPFIRFDPGCMSPTSQSAVDLLNSTMELCRNQIDETVHWCEGQVLIIDNWRVLHGRGSQGQEGERMLYRATFSQKTLSGWLP